MRFRASRLITRPRVLRWLAGLAAAGFGVLAFIYLTLPDVRPLAASNPETTAFMELRAAEARAAGRTPRRAQRWVPYARISNNLKRAVLVAEDARFWRHEGVDYDELRESIEANLERGRFARGGSTITQQLAKNLYLSPSRNPLRKLRELIIARRLEAALTKRRILELYLNVVEWGDGIYGAEAAARAYFRKPAAALDTYEASLLAAALVNARALSPARPTPRLVRRQRLILRRMGIVRPARETPVEAAPPAEREDAAPPPPEPVPVEPPSREP